jgi:hypothetical protein
MALASICTSPAFQVHHAKYLQCCLMVSVDTTYYWLSTVPCLALYANRWYTVSFCHAYVLTQVDCNSSQKLYTFCCVDCCSLARVVVAAVALTTDS